MLASITGPKLSPALHLGFRRWLFSLSYPLENLEQTLEGDQYVCELNIDNFPPCLVWQWFAIDYFLTGT